MRRRGCKEGVCEVVGIVAAAVADSRFRRQDSNGLPLGPDRIEQLYEDWMSGAETLGVPIAVGRRRLEKPTRFDKLSRQHRIPNKVRNLNLGQLAATLIENEGKWPRKEVDRRPAAMTRDEAIDAGLDHLASLPEYAFMFQSEPIYEDDVFLRNADQEPLVRKPATRKAHDSQAQWVLMKKRGN